MSGLESDTIGGYNGMLKKQQETEGEVLVSTVLLIKKKYKASKCINSLITVN